MVCVCQASQAQNQLESNKEMIPLETHEDEMERMRCEVQQCKEFIHAQQQLLQVSFWWEVVMHFSVIGSGLSIQNDLETIKK